MCIQRRVLVEVESSSLQLAFLVLLPFVEQLIDADLGLRVQFFVSTAQQRLTTACDTTAAR